MYIEEKQNSKSGKDDVKWSEASACLISRPDIVLTFRLSKMATCSRP